MTTPPTPIATQVKRCLDLNIELADVVEHAQIDRPDGLPDGLPLKLQDQKNRFAVWCGNIGAHRTGTSSLEHRLRDASHIRENVVSLLDEMESLTKDARAIMTGEMTPWDQMPEEEGEMEEDEDVGGEDDMPGTEIEQIAMDIKEVVDSLLRLSITIRNPAPHDRFLMSRSTDTSHFEAFDIQHVRSKFGDASPWLPERLGKAISRRRQYFKYRRQHHDKLAYGLDGHDENEGRVAPSTMASSIPDKLKKGNQGLFDDDTNSDADWKSQTSFATSVGDSEQRRVPPLPDEADKGPFECPFCFMIVSITDTKAWKKHVFSDLRPYVCLESDCLNPDQEFGRRHEWLEHMKQNHWTRYPCPLGCPNLSMTSVHQCKAHLESVHPGHVQDHQMDALIKLHAEDRTDTIDLSCSLCRQTFTSLKLFRRHVGRHQEQLSLFALPSIDNEDENGPNREVDHDSVSIATAESAASLKRNMQDMKRDARILEDWQPDEVAYENDASSERNEVLDVPLHDAAFQGRPGQASDSTTSEAPYAAAASRGDREEILMVTENVPSTKQRIQDLEDHLDGLLKDLAKNRSHEGSANDSTILNARSPAAEATSHIKEGHVPLLDVSLTPQPQAAPLPEEERTQVLEARLNRLKRLLDDLSDSRNSEGNPPEQEVADELHARESHNLVAENEPTDTRNSHAMTQPDPTETADAGRSVTLGPGMNRLAANLAATRKYLEQLKAAEKQKGPEALIRLENIASDMNRKQAEVDDDSHHQHDYSRQGDATSTAEDERGAQRGRRYYDQPTSDVDEDSAARASRLLDRLRKIEASEASEERLESSSDQLPYNIDNSSYRDNRPERSIFVNQDDEDFIAAQEAIRELEREDEPVAAAVVSVQGSAKAEYGLDAVQQREREAEEAVRKYKEETTRGDEPRGHLTAEDGPKPSPRRFTATGKEREAPVRSSVDEEKDLQARWMEVQRAQEEALLVLQGSVEKSRSEARGAEFHNSADWVQGELESDIEAGMKRRNQEWEERRRTETLARTRTASVLKAGATAVPTTKSASGPGAAKHPVILQRTPVIDEVFRYITSEDLEEMYAPPPDAGRNRRLSPLGTHRGTDKDADLNLTQHTVSKDQSTGMDKPEKEDEDEDNDTPAAESARTQRRTYTRMSRRYISIETLRAYSMEWDYDDNPDYVLIKRWVPEAEQDILWKHTRDVRSGRGGALPKTQDKEDKEEGEEEQPGLKRGRKTPQKTPRSKSPSLLIYLEGGRPG